MRVLIRANAWRWILILAVFCLLGSVVVFLFDLDELKEMADTNLPETVGQLLGEKRWASKLSPFLEKVNVKSDARFSDDIPLSKLGTHGDIIQSSIDGRRFIQLSKDGTLLRYGRLVSAIRAEPNRSEGALSKSDFLTLVEEIVGFEAFQERLPEGLTYDTDPQKIYYTPLMGNNGDSNIPDRGYWNINAVHIYKGFRCLSGVRIQADIRTGEIASISHLPFVMPSSLEENIAKDQALAIASTFAEKHGVGVSNYAIEKLIMYENGYFSSTPIGEWNKGTSSTRLCWVIGFDVPHGQSDIHKYEVLVDCASGDVAGSLN